MESRRMTQLGLKCKQFLIDTRSFKKSDRLFVTCNFSEYLTKGVIDIRAKKLFATYETTNVMSYLSIHRQEFDNWEKSIYRKRKLNKLKQKING